MLLLTRAAAKYPRAKKQVSRVPFTTSSNNPHQNEQNQQNTIQNYLPEKWSKKKKRRE